LSIFTVVKILERMLLVIKIVLCWLV